jgi:hypothetical protein
VIDELEALKRQYVKTTCTRIPDDLDDLQEEMAEFVTFCGVAERGVMWSEGNTAFLVNVDLPASAPTMIEFRAPGEADSE